MALAAALTSAWAAAPAFALTDAEATDRYMSVCVPDYRRSDATATETQARDQCAGYRPDFTYASLENCVAAGVRKGRSPAVARTACEPMYRADGSPSLPLASGPDPAPATPPAAAAAPAIADAEPSQVYTGLNTADWITLSKENGFSDLALRAGSTEKTNADKIIDGTVKGLPATITLYGCDDDGECSGVFFAGYFGKQDSFTAKMQNGFNNIHSAHLVLSGEELTLQLSTVFDNGVTKGHLASLVQVFALSITEAIDYKP